MSKKRGLQKDRRKLGDPSAGGAGREEGGAQISSWTREAKSTGKQGLFSGGQKKTTWRRREDIKVRDAKGNPNGNWHQRSNALKQVAGGPPKKQRDHYGDWRRRTPILDCNKEGRAKPEKGIGVKRRHADSGKKKLKKKKGGKNTWRTDEGKTGRKAKTKKHKTRRNPDLNGRKWVDSKVLRRPEERGKKA